MSWQNIGVLVRLEGELLVVGSEFECEVDERKGCKDIVGGAQCSGFLPNSDICRDAEKEKEYVLDCGCRIRVIKRSVGTEVMLTDR